MLESVGCRESRAASEPVQASGIHHGRAALEAKLRADKSAEGRTTDEPGSTGGY